MTQGMVKTLQIGLSAAELLRAVPMEKVQRLGGGRFRACFNRSKGPKIESVRTVKGVLGRKSFSGGWSPSRAQFVLRPGSHGWCMAVLSWWVALSG